MKPKDFSWRRLLLLTFLILLLASCGGGGGNDPISPAGKTFGFSGNEFGRAVQQTTDGGFIIAGHTDSIGAGGYDAYLVKTDALGAVEGARTFGGTGDDFCHSVQQTQDGGFVATGVYDMDGFTGNLFLLKLDGDLQTVWEKTFSYQSDQFQSTVYLIGHAVVQTGDGGYIITGTVGLEGLSGRTYLLKTDASGDKVWDLVLSRKIGSAVYQTADTGYVVAFVGSGNTHGEGGIAKISSAGVLQWEWFFNGSARSLAVASDGHYVITGGVTDNAGDIYLAKISSESEREDRLLWEKTFGSPGGDEAYALQETADGGFVIAGRGSHTGNDAGFNVYLAKTDGGGDLQWQKTFGGPGLDAGYSVRQTSDFGFVVVGDTTSFGAGGSDIYLIRTDANGKLQ
jgi:hypothetical protein